jgi:hypothetical protein
VWEVRKIELQTWKAYIVWSLKRTSSFAYQSGTTPAIISTWGSNILSACSIWVTYGRPTSIKPGFGRDWNNDAIFNVAKFVVSFSSPLRNEIQ